jgi:hypothetical protein
MTADFRIISSTDVEKITEFEESIYSNFIIKNNDQWILNNYIITDNNRARPNVGYEDLVVYAGYVSNKLVIGSVINLSTNHCQAKLISSDAINFEITHEYTEGLIYFFNPISLTDKVSIGFGFESFFYKDLLSRGYRYIFGTCDEKQLRLYTLTGWKIQNEYQSPYSKEFLIIKDMSDEYDF